jgi:hypothetical protein
VLVVAEERRKARVRVEMGRTQPVDVTETGDQCSRRVLPMRP